MKTNISKMAVTAGVVLLFCMQAFALPSLTVNRISGYYQSGFDGGEFTLSGTPYTGYYDSDATAGSGFQSFCLEKDEVISIPGTYEYQVSSAANAGGVGGPSPDPISIGTAWLYNQFASGALAGYQYTPGATRASHARSLQNAIWWLEEELTLTVSQINANLFIGAVLNQFSSATAAKVDATVGAYGVYVLNLTQNGARRQDQLVRIPDGGLTAAMLALSLVSGWIMRRKQA